MDDGTIISTTDAKRETDSKSRADERFDFVDRRSLPCENRPHSVHQEWTGAECDQESFFCFSEAVNNNCCKCRPECCGQCNILASVDDPYQACPVLSAKAYERSIEARKVTQLNIILIAFGCAFGAGLLMAILGAFCGYLQDRKRMAALIKDDKEKNLRDEYRDEDEEDVDMFRD